MAGPPPTLHRRESGIDKDRESEVEPDREKDKDKEKDREPVKVITGRPVSACRRCKTRKIKCTYDHPSCQACQKASVDCEYPNSDTPTWEQVKALEQRLKSVETLLHERAAHVQALAHAQAGPSPARSSIAASPQADSTAFQFRLGPPSSWQALGRLPSAVELLGVKVDTAEIERTAAAIPSVDLSDFPDPEGYNQVVNYYFNKINPFYGILNERAFRQVVSGLWRGDANPQTIHAAYVLLALFRIAPGDVSGRHCAGQQVARAAWEKSLLYLNHAWTGPPLGRLQSILLMLQYVLRDPNVGDVWDLSGRASRMALELGLHLDPTTSVDTLSAADIEMRRMLFWTTFNCDCLVSCALGRPRAFPVDWISTQLPSPFSDIDPHLPDHRKEAGVHHAKFRMLMADVHERLFAVSASKKASPEADWFNSVQARLDEWKTTYTPDASEYMNPDRLELHYALAQSAIYRPCPGNPVPSQAALYTAIRAASSVMRRYKTLLRNGELHFIWLGVHHVFMAGVTYLNSLWIANRHQWRIVPSYVDAILDIQTCSQVLEGLTAREPGTNRMRDAFEIVSAGVVRYLSSQTGEASHFQPGFPAAFAGSGPGPGAGTGMGVNAGYGFGTTLDGHAQHRLPMPPPAAIPHPNDDYALYNGGNGGGGSGAGGSDFTLPTSTARGGGGLEHLDNEHDNGRSQVDVNTGMSGINGGPDNAAGLGGADGFDFNYNGNFELERFLSNPFADLGNDTLEAQMQEFFNVTGTGN